MREFFGFGGYNRIPEGAYSLPHLLFVGSTLVLMVLLAIVLGLRNRHKDEKVKNKVLIVSAILIDAIELFKIVILCIRSHDAMHWLICLPLFLCSIQLITIPLAAFSKGRIKEAALDFVFVFGILGAIAGTIGAAQNYSAYPVLSFDNVVSAVTHAISGFCSLYIVISGMESMKKENIWILFAILGAFIVLAFIADYTIPYNYMFLRSDDGTPYFIVTKIVNGNKVLYPIGVILLFVIYVALFYGIYYLITEKRAK